jgi:dihydrofolate synthase/folylpolyglutamate synthase
MPIERSYQETIDYLYALQKHGIKLALANSFQLMEIMGDPKEKFRTVHVAGTNGKGSTSAFLASMLMAAGYRVGLYTSPHLVSFAERIRINNVPIPEAKVVELAQRVRDGSRGINAADGSGPLNPTFFEVTTAIAFAYFAEEDVDIAVIETGMGGRLDATNVITPLVSIITNIDLEHTEFLGDTLERIAAEKAGIVKPGVPVVTGAIQPEALVVIERKARATGSRVYLLSKNFMPANVKPGRSQRFDYRGIKTSYDALTINMLGRHQVDNACQALAAVECLRDAGVAVEESALRRGLEQARWEGRMELVAERPDIYLDGAHNPASAQRLAATLRDLKPSYRKLVLVIGILGDKDFRGIVGALVPFADRVVVTKPQYARALDVQTLASEVRKLHGSVASAGTIGEAIGMARDGAASDDLILATGSLYVVGDARALLVAGPSGALTGLKG